MNTLSTLVKEHPFLSRMKPSHLDKLAECAQEKSFEPGQVIFREGEPAGQFYLIRDGKVLLEAHRPGHGDVSIQTLGAGDALGWSWLFPPFAWHFQARTLEPTNVIIFDGGHLLVACEKDHDFGYELMKRMAQVVIHRLQANRKCLLQAEKAMEASGMIPKHG